MDPADGLFKKELYDLSYSLICIHGRWKRAPSREDKEAALGLAHCEVSSKPWLRRLLPDWLWNFIDTPASHPASVQPASCQLASRSASSFLGTRLAIYLGGSSRLKIPSTHVLRLVPIGTMFAWYGFTERKKRNYPFEILKMTSSPSHYKFPNL